MSFPDELRSRAVEQRKLANALITDKQLIRAVVEPDGTTRTDATNLLMAIVGQINATILESTADSLDYLRVATGEDSMVARRKAILERNDAVRTAAAIGSTTGNWDEFNRLTGIATPGGDSSGGGTPGGTGT
ncbi:hypothetical protein [Roseimaritima ulvae]|uniref:hypothetical protein n=1 Tax=Roseimaritima ulvae TaxID=980254 RepID=UPI00082D5B94|nr:hypothetical protein [Roseimaritima ulvae]